MKIAEIKLTESDKEFLSKRKEQLANQFLNSNIRDRQLIVISLDNINNWIRPITFIPLNNEK